uniref:Tryptophan synthase beta chain-like PALP domain-containing protein n=1 Tax=Ditylenchus dipsaci TaxID=166011 RepID=A0A915EG32_9BILA
MDTFPDPSCNILDSPIQIVGNTPLVYIHKICAGLPCKIACKIEYLNPACSVKDRIGYKMVENAERAGLIKPGETTLIEYTSGNTGIALAFVCAAKGYKLILTMPSSMSIERRVLLKAYGAEVFLTDPALGFKGWQTELLKFKLLFPIPTFLTSSRTQPISKPITRTQVLKYGNKLKVLLIYEKKPEVKMFAVEPYESSVLNGHPAGSHKIAGLGAGFFVPFLKDGNYEEVLRVKGEDAIQMAKRLAEEEGILGGISSGANVCAAVELAKRPENAGKLIVTGLASFGERYLSSDLYADIKTIMLEINTVIETIENNLNQMNKSKCVLDLSSLIDVAVGSVINQLVFGYRFIGDTLKEMYKLKRIMKAQVHMMIHPVASLLFAMPWLRHFPVFSYYFKQLELGISHLYRYFDKQIKTSIERRKKEAEVSSYQEDDTCVVDAFLHEMENRKAINKNMIEEPYFKIQSLRGISFELFFAGQETTSTTLKFLVLYMIVYPEVQVKMQLELDRVMGDNEGGTRRVTLAHRTKLPYTNAVINETQRFANLFPVNLLHRTTKDVECGGYKIAKGTLIVPVIASVLYNEKIFPEPHEFIPSVSLKMVSLRRESLAKIQLFLFTANVFYLYRISPENPNQLPTLKKVRVCQSHQKTTSAH